MSALLYPNSKPNYLSVLMYSTNRDHIIELENKIEEISHLEDLRTSVDTCMEPKVFFREFRRRKNYHILCIDLSHSREAGIKLAHSIRALDSRVHILFFDSNADRMAEVFNYMPASCMTYPLSPEVLHKRIHKIREHLEDTRLHLTFNFLRQTYHVPYETITYLESDNHIILVNTYDDAFQFYGRLDEVEKQLATGREPFLRIHQSFLVNFNYISCMDSTCVQTFEGTSLPVSASYREQCRKQYVQYAGI